MTFVFLVKIRIVVWFFISQYGTHKLFRKLWVSGVSQEVHYHMGNKFPGR